MTSPARYYRSISEPVIWQRFSLGGQGPWFWGLWCSHKAGTSSSMHRSMLLFWSLSLTGNVWMELDLRDVAIIGLFWLQITFCLIFLNGYFPNIQGVFCVGHLLWKAQSTSGCSPRHSCWPRDSGGPFSGCTACKHFWTIRTTRRLIIHALHHHWFPIVEFLETKIWIWTKHLQIICDCGSLVHS